MRFARRHSDSSLGWVHAAVFNAMLLALPLMAANAIAGIFAANDFPVTPRAAALEATRAEIISRFEALKTRDDTARARWAQLVDDQLRAKEMSAARGFLLAAPQMLDERDSKAVLQAAPQAVPFGSEDEQLVGAALLFLPNDVRVRYETATRPADMPPMVLISEDEGDAAQAAPAVASDEDSAPADLQSVSANGLGTSSNFSVLGTMADLAPRAREWASIETDENGRAEGGFLLRITGLGLVAEAHDATRGRRVAQATSLLRTAYRAGRLQPGFQSRLDHEVELALPASVLRGHLAEGGSALLTTEQQAGLLETALVETVNPDGLAPLLSDFVQVNAIIDAVGPVAGLSLIEHVRSQTELRKMRLISQAGGDRAIALETLVGRDVLHTARTGIELSRENVLEVMGLAATAMALFWLLLSTMRRYMNSPIRPFSYE